MYSFLRGNLASDSRYIVETNSLLVCQEEFSGNFQASFLSSCLLEVVVI